MARRGPPRGDRRGPWPIKLLISLLIFEVGLRLVPEPPGWRAGVFDQFTVEARLLKAVARWHTGEFNARGYRDVEGGPEPGRPTLVAIGDSRTYGLYVEEAEAFPALLRRGSGWSARNLGLPGATPFEAQDIVSDAVLLQPSAAVLWLDLNASLLGRWTRADSGRRGALGRQLWRSLAAGRWIEGLSRRALQPVGPVLSLGEHRRLLAEACRRLSAAGATRQIIVVGDTPLGPVPDLFDPERYAAFQQASREVAAEEGAAVLELSAVLAGLPASEAFVGPLQIHLSAAGHARLAGAIASALGAP